MPGIFKGAQGGQPAQPGGFKNFAIEAAPLFASLAAGYSSGRGPYAYLDQGIEGMQKRAKDKRDQEAAAAAAEAFKGLMPGGMGGVTQSSMGAAGGAPGFAWSPSQPMPKADVGVYGGGNGGLGFAGLPTADTGGAQGGLGFHTGGGDPTLGLIQQFEGFRETPYWDVNALRTGYGSDTITMPDGTVQRVTDGTRVTREDADRDLQRRVQTEFMPIAARAVGEETFNGLAPNQKAALTSIAYNYGELPSSVAAAVRSGDPQAAAEAIAALGSHNNGVNAGRRAQEARFYLAGDTGGGGNVTMSAKGEGQPPAMGGPVDPMADPYVQQLMGVMAMPGLTPEQQSVVQMQLQSRIQMITTPQPGAEEEAARAMRARDAELLGYQRGTPEWNQYVVTGEQPQAAQPIEVGGVLLDPTGKSVIFDSREPGARPMTAQERAQWGIPETDTTPYKMTDNGPVAIGGGGTTINNNMDGGGKFEEAFAKGDAATVETVYNAGLAAQRNLGRIDQLEAVLGSAPTGWKGGLKQVAGEMGIATEGLDAIQSARAIINSLVPEQRQPGSGPMSDADLELFKQSLPRIINQPGGNKIIIDTMRGIAEYDAQGARIVQRLRNGELTRAQAFDELQNRTNPLANIGGNAGGAAPSGAPAPGSVLKFDANGNIVP